MELITDTEAAKKLLRKVITLFPTEKPESLRIKRLKSINMRKWSEPITIGLPPTKKLLKN